VKPEHRDCKFERRDWLEAEIIFMWSKIIMDICRAIMGLTEMIKIIGKLPAIMY
jgi:hypothetical protein